MSERIANINVLCEDQEQKNLITRYLMLFPKRFQIRDIRYAPLPGKGSGEQYVRDQFAKAVKICRGTLGKRTKALLIVMTDADKLSSHDREQTLLQELIAADQTALANQEPIVLLIPRWQVETWIKCLNGQTMLEEDRDSDRPPVTPTEIKNAAGKLFEWTRNGAQIGAACVPSLKLALPSWQKIESLYPEK